MRRRRFTWHVDQLDGHSRVTLEGDISEDSDFDKISPHLKASVVIDLDGIQSINSTGVRAWILFMRALGEAKASVVLERCAVPIVHQMNHIANFRGDAHVSSIHAPYYCSDCDAVTVCIRPGTATEADLDQKVDCPKCGATMKFDDTPTAYLAFQRK